MAYPSKTDRATILAAAVKQLEREGLAGLSIRSVAGALGLAPNALYRYFADRAHLEAALSGEAAAQLHEALKKAAMKGDAARSVRSIALAYLQFARNHKPLYEMLMQPCAPEETDPQHAALWAFVVEEVGRLSGEADAAKAAVGLWAYLHGMVALKAMGVFEDDKKPGESVEFGLRVWLAGASAENGQERDATLTK